VEEGRGGAPRRFNAIPVLSYLITAALCPEVALLSAPNSVTTLWTLCTRLKTRELQTRNFH
jgi:hypothetical protein